VPLEASGCDANGTFELKAGESACFAFGAVAKEDTEPSMLLAADRISAEFERTMQYWREWMSKSRYTGHWREVVNRSALALKLLTSVDYGSVAAAATFGLPERIGGTRNWDYRYTWLRDSAFSMYAFMRLGFTGEAGKFTHWLRERVIDGLERNSDNGPLQIMYKMDGSPVDAEQELEAMSGYENSRPVRIGNSAVEQLQLDVYGAIFDAVYLSNKYVNGISDAGWRRVKRTMEWLEHNWDRPDEGIWEVRNGRKHFLHSRVMCWVSFDRMIRLALKRSLAAPLERWYAVRDAIYEDVMQNFWNEELGSFVQFKGSDRLDASAFMMPLLRFISPTDPRWRSTMSKLEEMLTEDVLVYRYGSGWDGLDGEEGSFTACGFWRIESLARSGEVERARLLFEKMLGYANHLGLYSEQLGRTGEQLGNFPQALTHLALISAATYLDRKLSEKPGDSTWE
jgi:GH15 family glucan-1,4-alpha-glucosidase